MGGQPGAGTPDTAIVGLGRVGQAASIFTRAGLIRGESWETCPALPGHCLPLSSQKLNINSLNVIISTHRALLCIVKLDVL